ncbi:MAG TPA: zinc-binding dehydrogenase [Candidatus Dormibacteraeota bacterium]|nr:zinc-binding dehydrogenase [Candidatus Dormibacteraeota bacterium]
MMTAARLHRIGAALRIDRVPVPRTASNDILVEVRASGICHSDLNYRNGIAPVAKLPIILGHEIAGVVARKGSRVKNFRLGERILVHYVSSCGRCLYCRTNRENYCKAYQMIGKDVDGGYAQYAIIPAVCAVRLPETIPFEQGAIMGCAVPTAYHALRRGRMQPKDTVVIIGVGGLGMHAVQFAKKIFRAGKVIAVDRFGWKLKRAKNFGADSIVNAATDDPVAAVGGITDGMLADVVLDFVGSEKTNQQAVSCVGKGGRLVLVGIGARSMTLSPYGTIIGKEIEIVGVDDHLRLELNQLVRLVRAGKMDLSHSVTHRVALENINEGFRILEDKNEKPIRVVVSTKD